MACLEFKNLALLPKIKIYCGRILIVEYGKVVRKFEFSKENTNKFLY